MLRRPRRLRINSATRNLVRETKLNIEDLIYPLFIVEGENIKSEISSLPDVYHLLITIPLAGKEYVPPFTLGTFIQKSLPNCCVSRTLVEDVNHAMKTDVAFCKVFSSLYYCLYMDMYPEDMMISGATRNFDETGSGSATQT